MEKPPSPTASSQSSLRELECVGRLEITRPKPVGFLCGSIPVPTDESFHAFNSAAALVPSPALPPAVSAPRYRMLPTETDLNTLPVVSNLPEKVLPIRAAAVQSKFTTGELSWESENISSNLSRKCEALAVSGLAEYGDEIDVIAPADILKQIFKIPYSKARLSIAVRRIGRTLVLNTGPDVEEGEKFVRRHGNQTKCADHSLFLNFAMHSVRMEACDCPPTHHSPSEGKSDSSTLHRGNASQFVGQFDDVARREGFNHGSKYPQVKQDGFLWESRKSERNKGHHAVKKASVLGEKPRGSMQESENHKRVSHDGFLRVLLWQFHNFRMLLGSDLLLFSNEKYVAVSLHLWDVSRQVTPLTWLEAWLDNVMASVPELAICYHQDGVVQGYELIKTDDIFLLKGISEDGTPAFHPHVVQQNGLSVLRFLQENCKQDPGAYWLYKNSGEDVIQLFDLSVMPKNHSPNDCDERPSSMPPLMHRGRSDSLFSLGTLLYRIAHRLSLSLVPNKRAKCGRFFQKCLEFLDEPDHLVVRAFAHEQFARLLLDHDEDLELTSESLTTEFETTVPTESLETFNSLPESFVHGNVSASGEEALHLDSLAVDDVLSGASVRMNLEANASSPRKLITSGDPEYESEKSCGDEMIAVSKMASTPHCIVQADANPITSKLAAVNHVSQAIKSLRWMRQLQNTEAELLGQDSGTYDGPPSSIDFSVCACGDADCIEVCDIREWLPTSKIDNKLWKLVLLLGESYLALGQAYKEDNQLDQALKVVELACSLYGSMPQHLGDTKFISSMVKYSSQRNYNDRSVKIISCIGDEKRLNSNSSDNCLTLEQFSSTYLFWAKAWTLVGDVYVEYHSIKGKELSTQAQAKPSARELRMSSEVVKEVQRLKKKLGQDSQNCNLCSLLNCSCQSDRASSGNSASSSSGDKSYGRRHGKRSHAKGTSYSLLGDPDGGPTLDGVEHRKNCERGRLQHDDDSLTNVKASGIVMHNSVESVDSLTMHDIGSSLPSKDKTASRGTSKVKNGGIFKYLGDNVVEDVEYNLSAALNCYGEARKALRGLPSGSEELLSVVKKIGWVCNEMGRNRLERKELAKAELAFADAISAFREVSDHTNIILINCNLGHGRRALAEEMVLKMESLKLHTIFYNSYKQALHTAKLEYGESVRFYGAAKAELDGIVEETHSVAISLRNEVYTQFAHTYLRLGMLLAKEDISAEVYENGAFDDTSVVPHSDKRSRKEVRKREISANDAIREALSLYESLGELRKQEAAYAYFHLACYQRDCCLKFLEQNNKKGNLAKYENSIPQRVKQYASLAERNWQKAMEFYGPKTHATMYLTILIERSALSLSLSSSLHSNAMLESALIRMLEGRHVSETTTAASSEVNSKFWSQLQMLLKRMLASALSGNTNKSCGSSSPTPASNRHGDAGKMRELYKMSLQSTDFSQLHAMYTLWTS